MSGDEKKESKFYDTAWFETKFSELLIYEMYARQ